MVFLWYKNRGSILIFWGEEKGFPMRGEFQ